MDRMLRPKKTVLPDSAMLETKATHAVSSSQPYYSEKPGRETEPAGTLPAGSRVRLISKGPGEMSQVADEEGRQVYTASAGLRSVD